MDCLWLRGSIVPWSADVPSHTDGRCVTSLLAPLTDGTFAWATLGNGMLIASAAIAFATYGFPPVLPCFPVAGTSSADVHGIRVSG